MRRMGLGLLFYSGRASLPVFPTTVSSLQQLLKDVRMFRCGRLGFVCYIASSLLYKFLAYRIHLLYNSFP